jgi:LacI family transcriptional regulator
MSKRATMTEVADAAGVSQTTVSMVLNNLPYARVAAATRARVLEVAQALGYSKGLQTSASGARTIGMLVDEVGTTPFYAPLIEGADDEASSGGCIVAAYRTRSDPAMEAAAITALQSQPLAGILYATLAKRAVSIPEPLLSIPTVMLNCYSRTPGQLSVLSADRPAAYAATEMLLEAGHKRIAHLAGESSLVAGREREEGYRQAMLGRDIPIDRSLIRHGAWTIYNGRELTRQLLGLADPPTALFCFNDRMAIGAYEAIRAHGLRIPEDISVIGFDNELDLAPHAEPPLTTIGLPHFEMAREAVRVLLDIDNVRASRQHPRTIKIECPLISRASVARPPAKSALTARGTRK